MFLVNIFSLALLMHLTSYVSAQNIHACESDVYCKGQLLDTIQRAGLFDDSKTFVDMNMKFVPATVLASFNSLMASGTPHKNALREFVNNFFDGPGTEFEDWTPQDYVENPAFLNGVKDKKLRNFGKSLCAIWEQLGRKISDRVKNNQDRYSLLYVDKPFIVPGGRFRETYYWDSLWVVHGLLRCEMTETVKGMLDNFMSIIDRLGFVPNGFRIYYTRRSQPPLLSWMVDSYFMATKDRAILQNTLPRLEKEYEFWMNNRSRLIMKDGKTYTLNQYSTVHNTPRPESYAEDVETAAKSFSADKSTIYSNLASAAESGWDFSSRWFLRENERNLELHTTVIKDIIPVDLNSILCKNEKLLAIFNNITGNGIKYREYMEKYMQRREAIKNLLWNSRRGVWQDFHIPTYSHRDYFFPSNIFPMYADCFGSSDMEKAHIEEKVFHYLEKEKVLHHVGGVPTSKVNTGQQWDLPNAWPPLQHLMIMALAEGKHSQSRAVAKHLAQSWVYTNWLGWNNTQHMFEKYDVYKVGRRGGGGEYGVQTGFGWTNGVILDLLSRYGDTLTTKVTVSSAMSPAASICLILFSLLIGST